MANEPTALVAANTIATNGAYYLTTDTVVIAKGLSRQEQVVIYIIAADASLEPLQRDNQKVILTWKNNATKLAGPCKYHFYKSITTNSVSVDGHV
jgi:hypothetical protein